VASPAVVSLVFVFPAIRLCNWDFDAEILQDLVVSSFTYYL
jgi:hypothetical protein